MHMKIIITWTIPAGNDRCDVIIRPNTQDVRMHKASIYAGKDDSDLEAKQSKRKKSKIK